MLSSFAMAPVDEWRIPAEGPVIIAALRTAVREHRLHALKFIPPLCHIAGDFTPWDDGPCAWRIPHPVGLLGRPSLTWSMRVADREFWEAVAELGVPVFFVSPFLPAPLLLCCSDSFDKTL